MSRAGTGSTTTTTTSEGKRARAFAELCGGASFSRGAMRGMGRAGGTRGSDGDDGVEVGGGGGFVWEVVGDFGLEEGLGEGL